MTDYNNWDQGYNTLGYTYHPQQQMTNFNNWDHNTQSFYQQPEPIYPELNHKLHHDFQQTQNQILEPMDDGQEEYPAGQLWEVKSVEMKVEPFSPFVGNNNNNNNGFIPQQANQNQNPWGQLEPVDQGTLINREIDGLRKKEKAKGYSAVCLAKKKDLLHGNNQLAMETKEQADTLAAENYLKEDNLQFAVNNVLIPFLGDNNSNIDLCGYQNIENQKEAIEERIREERRGDDEFQGKKKKLQDAKAKFEKAEFDQKNKDTIPVLITDNKGTRRVSDKTLATRVHRAKENQETCHADYNAALFVYAVKRQSEISNLLDFYWHHFAPYLQNILQNPASSSIWEKSRWNGDYGRLCDLRALLFNPG